MEWLINIKLLDQQLNLIENIGIRQHNSLDELIEQIMKDFEQIFDQIEDSYQFNWLLQRLKDQLKLLELQDPIKAYETIKNTINKIPVHQFLYFKEKERVLQVFQEFIKNNQDFFPLKNELQLQVQKLVFFMPIQDLGKVLKRFQMEEKNHEIDNYSYPTNDFSILGEWIYNKVNDSQCNIRGLQETALFQQWYDYKEQYFRQLNKLYEKQTFIGSVILRERKISKANLRKSTNHQTEFKSERKVVQKRDLEINEIWNKIFEFGKEESVSRLSIEQEIKTIAKKLTF